MFVELWVMSLKVLYCLWGLDWWIFSIVWCVWGVVVWWLKVVVLGEEINGLSGLYCMMCGVLWLWGWLVLRKVFCVIKWVLIDIVLVRDVLFFCFFRVRKGMFGVLEFLGMLLYYLFFFGGIEEEKKFLFFGGLRIWLIGGSGIGSVGKVWGLSVNSLNDVCEVGLLCGCFMDVMLLFFFVCILGCCLFCIIILYFVFFLLIIVLRLLVFVLLMMIVNMV